MQSINVKTSLGMIPLTGRFTGKLKVLAITGAFAPAEEMSRLSTIVAPNSDGVVATLPGNRSPELKETSIRAFSFAFDEVVEQIGPTVVLGLSVGGLVALGMRSPLVRHMVVVDPPLATAKLWPFFEAWRARSDPLIRDVLGFSSIGIEERGYCSLLDNLSTPTDVIVAEEPLYPVRAISRLPSLVDTPERERLAAHPMVQLHVAPNTGHNIPYNAAQFLLKILTDRITSAHLGVDTLAQ